VVSGRDGRGRPHDDDHLRAVLEQELDRYAGWSRWTVHVRDGGVVLCDEVDDPLEQHIATIIAAAVPGTVHVDTRHRASCPHHPPSTTVA
jgi:osmotically-inducible protein OsmY